jgi:hypothetical protein
LGANPAAPQVSRVDYAALVEREAVTLPLDHAFAFEFADIGSRRNSIAALAMVHSFFYPNSVQSFTEAAAADPQCAIAYWGIAISSRSNH